jgi:hypothetical protein
VSGAEILEGWQGWRVSIELARGGLLRGELVRFDAVGVLLPVEHRSDPTPEVGRVAAEPEEGTLPLFSSSSPNFGEPNIFWVGVRVLRWLDVCRGMLNDMCLMQVVTHKWQFGRGEGGAIEPLPGFVHSGA